MLSCVVILALFGMTYGQVDYGDCQWVYGQPETFQSCPSQYVGVGACGNKGQKRCADEAFGIYCCRMTDGVEGECEIKGGHQGDLVECAFGSQVFGTCGSLDTSRCRDDSGTRLCVTVDCCTSPLQVIDGTCYWTYGANQGESLFCRMNAGDEEVMTGRCGSETIAQCNDQVHGIQCCKIQMN